MSVEKPARQARRAGRGWWERPQCPKEATGLLQPSAPKAGGPGSRAQCPLSSQALCLGTQPAARIPPSAPAS